MAQFISGSDGLPRDRGQTTTDLELHPIMTLLVDADALKNLGVRICAAIQ